MTTQGKSGRSAELENLAKSARQTSLFVISLGARSAYFWFNAVESDRLRAEFHRLELTIRAIETVIRDPFITGKKVENERVYVRRNLDLLSDPPSECEIFVASGTPGNTVFEHRTIRDDFNKVDGRGFIVITHDYLCNFYVWGLEGQLGAPSNTIILFRSLSDQPWWVAIYQLELERFDPRLSYARTQIVFTKFHPQEFLNDGLENVAQSVEHVLENSTVLPYSKVSAFLRAKTQKLTGRSYVGVDEALRDILTSADTGPQLLGFAISQSLFNRFVPLVIFALSFAFWHRIRHLKKSNDNSTTEPSILLRPEGAVEKIGAVGGR